MTARERRVSEEHVRLLADSAYQAVVAIGVTAQVNTSHLAADLIAARAEIAKLKAVVTAAAALVDQWEVEHDCPGCEAKAEAMGGRCAPTCDICLERWAVAHDAYDDAREALTVQP